MNKKIKRLPKHKGVKGKRVKSSEIGISQKDQHAKSKKKVIKPASPRLFKWNNK